VIGLMPPGFSFMYSRAEVFLPLRLTEEQRTRRDNRALRVVARLAPGVSLSEADAELQALSKSIADLQPEAERGWRTRLRPLEMEVMNRSARLSIQTMFWAVMGVLLIACANIANLLLARGTLRQRELAIRVSLGAGKGRIIRLLLAESTVLAFLGGALGVLFAGWAIPVIRNLAPKDFPRLELVHLDSAALGYTFLLCLASSLVAGFVPAWLLSRNPLSHTLHEGGPRGTASRQRLLQGLVAAEVALAMTLLTLTGLLVRSLTHQLYADPGFDKGGLVTASVTLPQPVYPEGRQQAEFFRVTLETLRRDARIEQASAVQTVPLGGSYMFSPLAIEGRTDEGGQPAAAGYTAVLPGFFQTFRIQLVGGRDFDDRDGSETTQVAIVNETMARQYWPGDPSPVGRRFRLLPAQNTKWISIVGVARDIRTQSPMRPPRREFYLPLAQAPSRRMAIVVRIAGDPARAAGAIREAVWSADRDQPLGAIETIDDLIDRRAAGPRVTAQVIGFLGALALLLAGLGIYGVLSYLTAQRSREIGIRVALGAVRADVVGLVLRRGLLLAGLGLAAGTVCAAALTPLVRSLLEGVEPHDPASFILSAAALLSSALLACAFPVLRALRLDPVTILRQE
jgi:predicted permease